VIVYSYETEDTPCFWSEPANVSGSETVPTNAAPAVASVERHYSAFIPTTSCSAPVPRLGTQSLAGITRSTRSLCIGTTGSHVPYKSLIRIHAVFEPDATRAGLQVSALACPGVITAPGFDIICTVSTFHRRFAFARLSRPYLTESRPAVSATFTTSALNDSSSRWFGADS
jgi:hypothetical protein